MGKWLILMIGLLLPLRAGAASVAYSPQWLALGHYQPSGSGYKSSIDSDNFFLSPQGKTNPQAELAATIDLFRSEDDKRCSFPARYKYLQKQGLVQTPYPHCPEVEQFYEDLQPAGVTFLFTDAYMNNPSSLFGHTLLRIDTARKGTQLLAHGANYGAFANGEGNSVVFAILGLTGGYYGGFTVKPYYDIINTYNNIENRDIWELNLDFSPEELDFFVAHLWEVGQTQTRYYFFTKNCSYMLMETLDAVRPSLELAKEFPLQTIPLDTVKAVYRRPGLGKNINYRPSRQAKIRYRFGQMNQEEKTAYLEAIKNQNYKFGGVSQGAKADLAETAYQYIQYQYVARELELRDYRKRSFQALRTRNGVEAEGKFSELASGNSPLQAHEAMRATVGTGFRNGEAFQAISYRPAYHSLTDDNYGFLRGAEINFLNTELRHYDSQNKTVLQKFDLVGIKSLSPVDEMFKPLSYLIEAGIAREINPRSEKEGYAFNFKIGAGKTYALSEDIWFYGLGNGYASYGGFLPHNQWVGAGLTVGIYADFGSWRMLGEAEKVLATDNFADKMRYKIEAAYALSRNFALSFEYRYEQNYGKDLDESLLGARIYF